MTKKITSAGDLTPKKRSGREGRKYTFRPGHSLAACNSYAWPLKKESN